MNSNSSSLISPPALWRRMRTFTGAVLAGILWAVGIFPPEVQAQSETAKLPEGYSVPESTLSPDKKYGVVVPNEAHYVEDRAVFQNKLVEVATGKVLAVIQGVNGMEVMNHGGVEAEWSADGTLLQWKVHGKWGPRTVVLLKLDPAKKTVL